MPASRRPWLIGAAILLLALVGAVVVVVATGGEDEAEAQTIRFQKPTSRGPDPFTRPADVRGSKRVDVGSGPYGGTGSDLVCDRELLIRSLRARPDRLREWARVLGIEPTPSAVARYIRQLRPMTLTRDTRVTNHSFVNGQAVAYQAILQAGTAVLVDKDGRPVARCRCGNPLLEPIHVETARCYGCPPNYNPPPPCEYVDFEDSEYRRYGDEEFLRTYRRREYRGSCYVPNPDPPRVKRRPRRRAPATPVERATNPSASFSPSVGRRGDTFTLSASGFRPNSTLSVSLTRPDGVRESYSIRTGSNGSGSYTFGQSGGGEPLGTYTAVVTDPSTGDRATASTRLLEAETPPPEPPSDGGLQCNPPRSQLEFEQCRDAGRLESQQQEEECDVPRYRTNQCADIRDKSTEPGIQP